jgi:peroxiredoxin Q/BCP
MRRTLIILSCLLLAGLWLSDVARSELKVGDMAPAFELVGSDGKTYKLADYRDEKVVVLIWFPKAFTGG